MNWKTILEVGENQSNALLLFATALGHPALIEALLEEGADANVRDDEGRTPLMLTVAKLVDGAEEQKIVSGEPPKTSELCGGMAGKARV